MIQPIDTQKIDKALSGFVIPPRPDMLKQIQDEIDSDDPELKRIAAFINQDLGVAGFTLKVVNSPLFSLSKKVTTIEHACMFLGLERLIKLVRSILLRFTLSDGDESAFTQKIWNSSMEVANAAMTIAKHLDLKNSISDDCYTLGLFHNAGMALAFTLNNEYEDIVSAAYNTTCISEHEESQMSSSHEVLGYLIAKSWGLTKELSNVIAYHHSPQIILATGEDYEKQLFALLKLSEHIIGLPAIYGGANTDFEWEANKVQILDLLRIDEFQLDDLGDLLFQAGINNIYH